MKYFTPELYIEFNSHDPAVATRAEHRWERATSDYKKHVAAIRKQLPTKTRELAEKVYLHDAEYLGYMKIPPPGLPADLAVVTVKSANKVTLLIYVLAEEPSLTPPIANPIFSEDAVHWLYDEVDVASEHLFSHEILLSNGRMLTLRFVQFDMFTMKQDANGHALASVARSRAG